MEQELRESAHGLNGDVQKHHPLERNGVVQLDLVNFDLAELARQAFPACRLQTFWHVTREPPKAVCPRTSVHYRLNVVSALAQEDIFSQTLLDCCKQKGAVRKDRHLGWAAIFVEQNFPADNHLIERISPFEVLHLTLVTHVRLLANYLFGVVANQLACAGHLDRVIAIGPAGDGDSDENSTPQRHDHQQDYQDELPTALAFPERAEDFDHALDGTRRMFRSAVDVVHLSKGVPAGHADVSKAASLIGPDQRVHPQGETRADQWNNHDEIPEAEHCLTLFRRKVSQCDHDHSFDRENHPTPADSSHDKRGNVHRACPTSDSLGLRVRGAGPIGVEGANHRIDDQKHQQK